MNVPFRPIPIIFGEEYDGGKLRRLASDFTTLAQRVAALNAPSSTTGVPSGGTVGQVLTRISPSGYNWRTPTFTGTLPYANLTGVPTSFAPSQHLIADAFSLGPAHSISAPGPGSVLLATGTQAAKMGFLNYSQLGDVDTSNLAAGRFPQWNGTKWVMVDSTGGFVGLTPGTVYTAVSPTAAAFQFITPAMITGTLLPTQLGADTAQYGYGAPLGPNKPQNGVPYAQLNIRGADDSVLAGDGRWKAIRDIGISWSQLSDVPPIGLTGQQNYWTGQNIFRAAAVGAPTPVTISAASVLNSTPVLTVCLGAAPALPAGNNPNVYVAGSGNTYAQFFDATNGVQALFGALGGGAAGFLGTSTNHNFNFRSNNIVRMNLLAAGGLVINAPTSGVACDITGVTGQYALKIHAATVNANGFNMNAGTGATDFAVAINNQANSRIFMQIVGDGSGVLGNSGGSNTIIKWASGVQIGAPAGGDQGVGSLNLLNLFTNPTAGVGITANAVTGQLAIDAQNGIRSPATATDRQPAGEGDILANSSVVVDDYMLIGAGQSYIIGANGTLAIGLNAAPVGYFTPRLPTATTPSAGVNRQPATDVYLPPMYNLVVDDYMSMGAALSLILDNGATMSIGVQAVPPTPTNGIF